jgi:hypothetical protein
VAGCGPHFRLFPAVRERREIIVAQ